jgi:hypothetical protein
MLRVLITIIYIMLVCSCGRNDSRDMSICVYKTKNDYSKNVYVELTADKMKITSAPGPNDLNFRWPVKLVNGYFLNGTFGPNTAYLSLTREDYIHYEIFPGTDSLFKLLIDEEPYIVFYLRNDDNNMFRDENGAFGVDTVRINELIRNNELEQFFDRLK